MDDVLLDAARFSTWVEDVSAAWPSAVLDGQVSLLSTALTGVEDTLAQASTITTGLFSHASGGAALQAGAELAAAHLAVSSAAAEHQEATADLAEDARALAEEIHQTDLDAAASSTTEGPR